MLVELQELACSLCFRIDQVQIVFYADRDGAHVAMVLHATLSRAGKV
jgi:hypothetical protein